MRRGEGHEASLGRHAPRVAGVREDPIVDTPPQCELPSPITANLLKGVLDISQAEVAPLNTVLRNPIRKPMPTRLFFGGFAL